MAERKYKKLDALTCEITETSEVKKNFQVGGILAKKKEIENQLKMVDEVILGMKEQGCVFEEEKVEETPKE